MKTRRISAVLAPLTLLGALVGAAYSQSPRPMTIVDLIELPSIGEPQLDR